MGCCGLDWSGSGWGQVESSFMEPEGSMKRWEAIEWLYNPFALEQCPAPKS
jgi:hypothetical protein